MELQCSLSKFLAAASLRWGCPVSQNMVAKATGLSKTTITRLTNNALSDIELPTIGLLCAYFGCQPGEILTLRGPLDDQAVLAAVRRQSRPDHVDRLPVINHIPEKLEPFPTPGLVDQLQLGGTSIWRLRQPTLKRVSSEALIALAQFFKTTDISDFLSVELP